MTKKNQKISEEEVGKIAKKAKLNLTEGEIKKYQEELASILTFINQLNDVKTEGVQPTYQVHSTKNVLREDKLEAKDKRIKERIIKIFSDKQENFLKIPPVF